MLAAADEAPRTTHRIDLASLVRGMVDESTEAARRALGDDLARSAGAPDGRACAAGQLRPDLDAVSLA